MKKRVVRNSIAIAVLFLPSFILGINLLIPTIITTIFVYMEAGRPKKAYDCKILHLSLLFLIIFAIGHWVYAENLNIYYIPFSLISMLVIILWQDLMISLFMILACGFSLAIEFKSLDLGIVFFVSAIISTVLLVDVRRRSQIIRAGFIVGLFQSLTWLLIQDFSISNIDTHIIFFVNGIACGIAVVGFLPVFEYIFNRITNISLLELSDFNQPVLKKLMLEAPGTYHHSLIVGNLSEAACEAVGANALLARIGAYYHDIGKIGKAEYFSENQNLVGASKHEDLSPSMSKLVIINHVKEGEALSKRYRINPRITDFILQHHGTSLVYYFYRRALENEKTDQEVREEGFRYPGPKPKSKETAIVLLADSVEAATRSIKEPTPNRIEQEVHKIINNKFIDGQLDECELTLKDLEKISGIFIRLLTSIYHSRITYPKANRANNHHKSAKENPHQQEGNKNSRS